MDKRFRSILTGEQFVSREVLTIYFLRRGLGERPLEDQYLGGE